MARISAGFDADYDYYVGILDYKTHELKFVTSVEYNPKVAHWDAGKPAMKMSKTVAYQLHVGLGCNGYTAIVLSAPDFWGQDILKNFEETQEETK